MKLIPFEKYEGAGNDFIIFDFMNGEIVDLENQIFMEKLCHRHFGIGADGIMALCPEKGYDFRMKYLNSDGKFSSFCGNGSRCISLYASRKWNKNKFSFIADDGPHLVEILEDSNVCVQMKNIQTLERTKHGPLVQSGSPHLIHEVKDAFHYDVIGEGRRIRNEFSKEGANVNFITIKDHNKIQISTYERGVEFETLACGTGIVAASYYLAYKNKSIGLHKIQVEAKGGALSVDFIINSNLEATQVQLIGPARLVYSGFWPL